MAGDKQHGEISKGACAYNGLEWKGFPFVMPFLQSTTAAGCDFVFAGFFQPETTYPTSADVFKEIYGATNLAYYDWELTGRRIEQLIYVGQLMRLAANRPQLAQSSPGLLWLKALIPKLGNAITDGNRTETPGRFTFDRKSSIGLTAVRTSPSRRLAGICQKSLA